MKLRRLRHSVGVTAFCLRTRSGRRKRSGTKCEMPRVFTMESTAHGCTTVRVVSGESRTGTRPGASLQLPSASAWERARPLPLPDHFDQRRLRLIRRCAFCSRNGSSYVSRRRQISSRVTSGHCGNCTVTVSLLANNLCVLRFGLALFLAS